MKLILMIHAEKVLDEGDKAALEGLSEEQRADAVRRMEADIGTRIAREFNGPMEAEAMKVQIIIRDVPTRCWNCSDDPDAPADGPLCGSCLEPTPITSGPWGLE